MSDLWTLSVYIAERQQPLQLVYHSAAAAQRWYAEIQTAASEDAVGKIELEDDYGTRMVVMGADMIESVVLQDCSRASEGAIGLGLQNARTQARGQERAARDPALVEFMRKQAQRQNLVQAMPMGVMPAGKM